MKFVAVVVVFTALISCAIAAPLWKVFCQGTPLFRGRVDPIVNPGAIAQHSHKVFGGSAFDFGNKSTDPGTYFNQIFASNCTTCTITIDKSVYWVPDLYYQWPNKSLSLVPQGGLTVYYPSRAGSGAQSNPNWQAIPAGLRIVAGSPTRRTYNASIVAQKAISYACLSSTSSGPETGEFPTATRVCDNGLRAQVWFPMCWNGKDLDSADHFSHMSYPIEAPDGGNCPATHPVRIPGIFFELLFSVSSFPHGKGVQPFLWSNGDATGNGLHGDFLNGWDAAIMQKAINDPSCDISNTNFGNSPEKCAPFTPYVKSQNPDQSCLLEKRLNTYEDLGINHMIPHLPGCNPITGEGAVVTPCQGAWPQSKIDTNYRVAIRAKNGLYWSIVTNTDNLAAKQKTLTYSEMFTIVPQTGANSKLVAIQSEIMLQFMSDNSRGGSPFKFNRWSPSGWEFFTVTYINGTGPSAAGTPVTILANSNGQYLQQHADGTIWSDAKTVTDASYFYFVDTNPTSDTRTSTQGFTAFETSAGVSNLQGESGESAANSVQVSVVAVVLVLASLLVAL